MSFPHPERNCGTDSDCHIVLYTPAKVWSTEGVIVAVTTWFVARDARPSVQSSQKTKKNKKNKHKIIDIRI